MASQRPSLQTLPAEISDIILSYLPQGECLHTLARLALCSQTLYVATTERMFRDISCKAAMFANENIMPFLLMRTLTVKHWMAGYIQDLAVHRRDINLVCTSRVTC